MRGFIHKFLTVFMPDLGKEILDKWGHLCYPTNAFRASRGGISITYAVVVPAILMIIGICTVFNVDYDAMLMGLINPEYGAINYILEYTKGIIK